MNLNELTIEEASAGIRKRSFTVSNLVDDCLVAIREKNSDLKAYLDVFEHAQNHAKEADQTLAERLDRNENIPPLFGIPIAIKDNILLEGMRATAGSHMLQNYIASYDATVIRKLKDVGAIFLGKTNLDEFAMGSSTEHSAFGPTKNPHDPARVPGGSSGGSAAAVAANLCIAALGSDTGGSIRQPASFCGIVGLKPTYGAVSRHGLIAMASSLDQIGPMTKTVGDAKILFDAIRGPDAFDATATNSSTDHVARSADNGVRGLRIGVPKEYFDEGLDANVADCIKSVITRLEREGATVEEVSLPHAKYALPAYYIVVPSEVSANLARFDGIRYGRREETATTLLETYEHTRAAGFGPEVKRRIMLGTYALSAGYYDAYYTKAQKVRRLIAEDFEHAFRNVDVVVGPTTPTPAFPFGSHADPVSMYLADIYTVAVNLAGVPALTVPVESVMRDTSALPVGLQIIGPRFSEALLFQVGEKIEQLQTQ